MNLCVVKMNNVFDYSSKTEGDICGESDERYRISN